MKTLAEVNPAQYKRLKQQYEEMKKLADLSDEDYPLFLFEYSMKQQEEIVSLKKLNAAWMGFVVGFCLVVLFK
jgi:hypothetical protein